MTRGAIGLRIAIVTLGILPIPAVRGGAVESLVNNLVIENEKFKQLDLEVFTIYDQQAQNASTQYKNTRFSFVKPFGWVRLMDKLIYIIAKNILKLEKNMSYRYVLQRLYFIFRVADWLDRNEYDRVVFENHPTLLMALKRKGNAVKYEGRYDFHLHNEMENDFNCGDLIRNCNKVLSVSNFMNQCLAKRLPGIEPAKLDVLRNCVDINRFASEKNQHMVTICKQKYGIRDADKVVLFVGRLTQEKGIKELLCAFQKIKDSNVKLLIAGGYFFDSDTSSFYENELRAIAKGMSNKVIFTGFIAYDEIPDIYAIADISVIPSIWNDPAPLTVIEAMAAGTPLITTHSGGIPEYANERCAIILERDLNLIDNLAHSIDKLLSNDALREQMAKNARETVGDLNLENYYQNFVKKL
jgi:spore coat protein SA